MTKQREYLTTAEVAGMRRMKEASLAQERFRMMNEGGDGPPFIKDGGRVLYPSDLLEAWLERRLRVSESGSASA
jgi:hypothetical protein